MNRRYIVRRSCHPFARLAKYFPSIPTLKDELLSFENGKFRYYSFCGLLNVSEPITHDVEPPSSRAVEAFVVSLLDVCTQLSNLVQIHCQLIKMGLNAEDFVAGKLIHLSSNLGDFTSARKIFEDIPQPNIFHWNAVIRGCVRHDLFWDALCLFCRMHVDGVTPDGFTFPYILKACSSVSAVLTGRVLHAQILKLGSGSDVFVQNGLIAMYAKCGNIHCARKTFDYLYYRTVVSWTSLLSGYAQNGLPLEALRIFQQMQQAEVSPDWIALVSLLKAYTDVGGLQEGKSVHSFIIKVGLEMESDLLIALTSMYAKCGEVSTAKVLFDLVSMPSVILWNAMISGYANNGHADEAVKLFKRMICSNINPDSVTLRSAIVACAQVGSLDLARWMDGHVCQSEFQDDVFVNTTVVDMYAKCGSIEHARKVFDRVQSKDVVVWSAMIMSYGLHGIGHEAINFFHLMRQSGLQPNDVTFVALLSSCNHSGLVQEGWKYFHSMKEDYGIEPRHQHYACVVDLLSRAGFLGVAYKFVASMPIEPEVTIWGALLSASRIYKNVKFGEYAAEKIFALEPTNAGHYVQLSNLYASVRMWRKVAKVRTMMRERGLVKTLGNSSIEINGKLQSFRVGDKSHPKYKEIMRKLEEMERKLKDAGFTPNTDSVLHDLNFEEKEESLCNHSERLAIAYGLITTTPGTTLRITKNLRACVNCHAATKLISKIVDREIVVRDSNRFHHFRDGSCSCNDYW